MNTAGELNVLYLKALKEIKGISTDAKEGLADRISAIRHVLDKLADDTWKIALEAQLKAEHADKELAARRRADGTLATVLREHAEEVEALSKARYISDLEPMDEEKK